MSSAREGDYKESERGVLSGRIEAGCGDTEPTDAHYI